jgi:hypothetical protein
MLNNLDYLINIINYLDFHEINLLKLINKNINKMIEKNQNKILKKLIKRKFIYDINYNEFNLMIKNEKTIQKNQLQKKDLIRIYNNFNNYKNKSLLKKKIELQVEKGIKISILPKFFFPKKKLIKLTDDELINTSYITNNEKYFFISSIESNNFFMINENGKILKTFKGHSSTVII